MMRRLRVSVDALFVFLVEELAVRYQGTRFRSVEAPGYLLVIVVLAARFAILCCAFL